MKLHFGRIVLPALIILTLCSGCVPPEGPAETTGTPLETTAPDPYAEAVFTESGYPVVRTSVLLEGLAEDVRRNFTRNENAKALSGAVPGTLPLSLSMKQSDVLLLPEVFAGMEGLDSVEGAVKSRFAVEGFVFFVSAKNPVRSLTKSELAVLYRGETGNWSELGGNDVPVTLTRGEEGSAEAMLFDGFFPGLFSEETKRLSETDVFKEEGFVGYTTFENAKRLFSTDKIRFLEIDGIAPNDSTIRSGDYPFLTGYMAVIRGDAAENAKRFVETLLSERGQMLVRDAGFSPILDNGFIGHEDQAVDPPEFSLSERDTYVQDSIFFSAKGASHEGVHFEYPSIDGLKDPGVENRVNLMLFGPVADRIKEIAPLLQEGETLETKVSLASAFQNTVSVATKFFITKTSEDGEKTTEELLPVTTNLSLEEGKAITVQQLFNAGTRAKDVFGTAVLKAFSEISQKGEAVEETLLAGAAFERGDAFPFVFDEQTLCLYVTSRNGGFMEAYIRFEDVMEHLAVYDRFRTETELYDGAYPKRSDLPVLMKRPVSYFEIVEKEDNAYVDVDLYNTRESDPAPSIAEDAYQRILERLEKLKDGHTAVMINASLELNRIANATFEDKAAPYYVTVNYYLLPFESKEAFDSAYLEALRFLRSEGASENMRQNLFLPVLSREGAVDANAVESHFFNWYYDDAAQYLGEK